MIITQQYFKELASLAPEVIAAIFTLIGVIITVIVGKIFLSARDKLDRESEWRKHAIELTKLDIEVKLKCRKDSDEKSIRPSILDFLANYRDLQELGKKTPKELYEIIISQRTMKHKKEENKNNS